MNRESMDPSNGNIVVWEAGTMNDVVLDFSPEAAEVIELASPTHVDISDEDMELRRLVVGDTVLVREKQWFFSSFGAGSRPLRGPWGRRVAAAARPLGSQGRRVEPLRGTWVAGS